ncbi:class I SAM-dependent methyltransferase [Methanospirillum sp.]|uniref:class I SAM-dependent methyltransferase n=1 Tax=Methanospirillum sp. TaxID=45200 RepID=UPI0035A06C12
MNRKTREPQYQVCLDIAQNEGLTSLGLMTNQVWKDDPRRLVFTLSRYKFVSKMFSGFENVLEIGCADAFGSRIILQECEKITVTDFDPVFIDDVKSRNTREWMLDAYVHDILTGPVPGKFDGIFSLDVLEHINQKNENLFFQNILTSLKDNGVLIIGTPSIESQVYASPPSKEGHINCKSGYELKELLLQFFERVFLFSMNDEVVHTGFYPMSHYLFALCCMKK